MMIQPLEGVYEEILSLDGLRSLVYHEGEAIEHGFHVPYQDSLENWTIGVGHLLTEEELIKEVIHLRGDQLHWRYGLSNREALELLEEDVLKAGIDRKLFLKGVEHPIEVTDVITEMAFQLGRTRLFTFKRLREALEGKDYLWAAEEILNSKLTKRDTPKRGSEYAAKIARVK